VIFFGLEVNQTLSLFGVMVFDNMFCVLSEAVDTDKEEEYKGKSFGVHSVVTSNEP
jgi:hypothetical protein